MLYTFLTATEEEEALPLNAFFYYQVEEDVLDYVVLSKPPPICICNHSGDEPRLKSLVGCEPNAIPVVSNVC